MARGINKVTILGNLGGDPEVKYMPSGGAVTNVSVAVDESYKDKNTGQMVEKVEWIRCVFFNRIAEIAGEFLKKGSKVYLEGAMRTRKWQNAQGVDQYTTEVIISEMRMLDGKPQDGSAGTNQSNQRPAQQQNAQPNNAAKQQQTYQQPPQGFEDFDDSIPV